MHPEHHPKRADRAGEADAARYVKGDHIGPHDDKAVMPIGGVSGKPETHHQALQRTPLRHN